MIYTPNIKQKKQKNEEYDQNQEKQLNSFSQSLVLANYQQRILQLKKENLQKHSRSSISQNSYELSLKNEESNASLEETLVSEHLACLESTITKISRKIFRITNFLDQVQFNDDNCHQIETTFKKYLEHGKSLIPFEHIPFFLHFTQKHSNFNKILSWIYENVQLHLGDQLILIAYKILAAYLPIQFSINSIDQIVLLAKQSFNLQNIYFDNRLRLLNACGLYQINGGILQFNYELHNFYQSFLQTIVLVLQEYFHNPGYTIVLEQKQDFQKKEQKLKLKKVIKKKKRIEKQKMVK